MKAVIDGANPTIVQARQTAREMGVRASMMYASTPGDLETDEGKEWQKILDNLPDFDESKMHALSTQNVDRSERGIYTVKENGETPQTIAEKYKVDAQKCASANSVALEAAFSAGTSIFVPDAELDWMTRQEINGDLFKKPLHSRYS